MSINKSCFDDAMNIVVEILNRYNITEKQDRINKITKILNKMMNKQATDREFYSLVHEIKSYDFVRLFGEATLANDVKHEPGPDIKFKKNRIECVCCSEGDILELGYEDYSIVHCKQKSKVINYNKTKEFLLPRITNALYHKKNEKIERYIKNNVIQSDECAIIFISLGQLNIDFHAGDYGNEILEVLIGKGPLTYALDRTTNKVTDIYWQKIKTVKKQTEKNLVDIPADFFNTNNINISGVLFSTANIYERYNVNNTFLFLNPYAKNQIDINDFKHIIYWKSNENNEYIPMKDDKNLLD